MKNQIIKPHPPQMFHIPLERRKFLKAIAAASAGLRAAPLSRRGR